MKARRVFIDFCVVFAITFTVSIIVTLLWNTLFHASAVVDWETSIRLASILGVVLPLIRERENEVKEK